MKPPAPGPVRVLSETQETRAAATAASTALPPSRSTRAPASAVSGWPAATAPFIQGNVVSTRQTDRPVSSSEGMPVFPQVQIRALASRRSIAAGGVFTVIAAMRLVVFGIVLAAAAALGAVPLRPVFLVVAVGLITAAVAFATRNRSPRTHVAHLLDAFRSLGRSPARGAGIAAWI